MSIWYLWGISGHLHVFHQVTNFLSKKTATPPPAPAVPSAYDPSKPPDVQAQPGKPNPFLIPPQNVEPAWPLGIDLSIYVYLSTSPTGDIFSRKWTKGWRSSDDADLPRFSWENITYIQWLEREKSRRLRYLFTSGKNYQISRINLCLTSILIKSVMNNGSLWADIFLVRNGADPDPSSSKFDPSSIHHVRKRTFRLFPQPWLII